MYLNAYSRKATGLTVSSEAKLSGRVGRVQSGLVMVDSLIDLLTLRELLARLKRTGYLARATWELLPGGCRSTRRST